MATKDRKIGERKIRGGITVTQITAKHKIKPTNATIEDVISHERTVENISAVSRGLLRPIYDRIDNIENRLDNLENRMDNIDNRLGRVEDVLQLILKKLS